MKCPLSLESISTSINQLNTMLSLPWTPLYTQAPPPAEFEFWGLHVMALTITFTVGVFCLEHVLDERQKVAYQSKEFPQDLSKTVGKIDSETKNVKRRNGSHGSATDGKDESINTGKPLLPQLQAKFEKSQLYGRDKIKFSMVSSAFGLFETTASLLFGLLPYTWDLACQWGETFGWNEKENKIKISLIFLLISTLIGTVTGLPFELYSTFQIEKKHGFNKQTPALFFTDKLKSLLLTIVIGGPFVSILLRIIQWGGSNFYVYVWGFMFVFSVIMMTIVPEFIMPMFNKYEPLKESDLKTRIYALADTLSFPLTKLFVMDGSKRSSHSNAFMFGFGKNKRIVLYDTLMNQVSTDEILAILGHELGHWKLGHTLSNFVVTQLYTGASFYAFSLFFNRLELYQAFGFDGIDRPIPIIIALTLFFQSIWAPVDKVLSYLLTLFSRHNEFAADAFSAGLDYGAALQTGLCKISLENLGALRPDPWYATYHYSHPPLVERLSAMIRLEAGKKKAD